MAEIGEPQRHVEIIPAPIPEEAPVQEPAPEPVKEPA